MNYLIIIFIGLIGIFIIGLANSIGKTKPNRLGLIKRFKKRFKSQIRLKEKFLENYTNSLLINPDKNIHIGSWDTEEELRTKADIHRARLSKHGRSRMNNEMLYLGPKGGVYKLTTGGNKVYI